jgi:hypothetical protein
MSKERPPATKRLRCHANFSRAFVSGEIEPDVFDHRLSDWLGFGVAVDARGAGYQMAHEFVLRSFRDSARVAGVRKIVPQ